MKTEKNQELKTKIEVSVELVQLAQRLYVKYLDGETNSRSFETAMEKLGAELEKVDVEGTYLQDEIV